MLDYRPLYRQLEDRQAQSWLSRLPGQLEQAFSNQNHGDLSKWQGIIQQIPNLQTNTRIPHQDVVSIGQANDLGNTERLRLARLLRQLHPWRKGPYELYGVFIDSEWRSDWKWQRLQDHISPLQGRLVLDVGCGNGYHCWRMYGAGAKMVIGIDPTLLSVMQFHAIRHLYGAAPVYVLPLGIESIPYGLHIFDTVFSMGVFYHRRSPIDHILELRDCLRPGGELILETLVIEGQDGEVLLPEKRYAKMRNVWFIPSCATLMAWMKRCGLNNIRLLDISKTTTNEQRRTDWMRFHSLADFLDPENPQLTVEGYPAPRRAVFIAEVS